MVTNIRASFLMYTSLTIFFAINFTVLNVAGTWFCSLWPSSTKARIMKLVTNRQTIIVSIQLLSVTQVNTSSSIEKIENPSRRPTFVPEDWIGPAHFKCLGSLFSIQLSAVISCARVSRFGLGLRLCKTLSGLTFMHLMQAKIDGYSRYFGLITHY